MFFLQNAPTYKKIIFPSTEAVILSSTVYKGENTLVIESKTHEGYRVLLNREDLMELLNLKSLILRNITRLEKSKKDNDSLPLPPSFSPPTYPSLSPSRQPSYPSFVKEKRGDDHNNGPFGLQYINSSEEEEYNISNYVIQL
ncbi:Hypothetical protein CINCED_3A025442 [Cinara cedri]|uniref:Uncharacterized protein n=1 Tax=Cinara cedri TaxID=506608 RepID=A0A5E4MU98_9HEMI|nr:Hypothetical protein CINCED_3A025442 [Cinara cedri]